MSKYISEKIYTANYADTILSWTASPTQMINTLYGAACFGYNSAVYVIGGNYDSTSSNHISKFEPATDTFTKVSVHQN